MQKESYSVGRWLLSVKFWKGKAISYGRETCGGVACICEYFLSEYMSVLGNGIMHFFILSEFEIKHCIIWDNKSVQEISTSVQYFFEEYSVELKAVEVNNGDLGTRIYRKGAERMVSAGCTVYPIITSLCIQCGWSMGGVKERDINY